MCMCMYVDLCVAGEKEDDRLNKGIGKGMIFWMQQYNITIIFQNPKQLDVRWSEVMQIVRCVDVVMVDLRTLLNENENCI